MIPASQYASASVTQLLDEAAHGRLGIDQRWLKAILDRGPAAAPEIIAFGQNYPESARLDMADDLVAMLRYLKAPAALDFYLDYIRQNPDDVTDDVHLALHEIGAPATERLLALYEELGEEQGGEVAFALASIRPRDPRVLAVLTGRLEYDMEDAALQLGLYGDPAARPALEKYLAEDPENPYLLEALEEIKNPEAPAENETFDIWRSYPEVTSPEVHVLLESERLTLLEQGSSSEDRVAAAHSFFGSGASEGTFKRLTAAAEADPDAAVRGELLKVLGGFSREHPELAEGFWAKLTNPSLPLRERGGALVAIAFGTGDDDKVAPFIQEIYANPETRRDAMEAMWRSNDKRWGDYFMKHLEDADRELQRAAVRGVGFCQIRGEANRLKQFFRDEDLREEALYAYALATPSDPSPARMRALLKKIDTEAGLSDQERELIMMALDERMEMAGKAPVFLKEEDAEEDDEEN